MPFKFRLALAGKLTKPPDMRHACGFVQDTAVDLCVYSITTTNFHGLSMSIMFQDDITVLAGWIELPVWMIVGGSSLPDSFSASSEIILPFRLGWTCKHVWTYQSIIDHHWSRSNRYLNGTLHDSHRKTYSKSHFVWYHPLYKQKRV